VTVQELRETITRLVELLRAADAKANTLRELNEFIESTAAFGDLTLKAFVKLAEAGRTPPKQPTVKTPRTVKASADPTVLSREVESLYARAADPTVTEEQIQTACGQLTPFKKETIVKVAESVGLEGMKSKPKGEIVTAITTRLLDRKGSAIRSQLIGRPATPDSSNAPMGGVASAP
jgi:hypothetical protein